MGGMGFECRRVWKGNGVRIIGEWLEHLRGMRGETEGEWGRK